MTDSTLRRLRRIVLPALVALGVLTPQ
ncbi:MAG: hypothetical protein QOE98_2160, partial [Gaiellaceae bacterium]|nr:hypothetical protein [Gaiellaceae bacterium]